MKSPHCAQPGLSNEPCETPRPGHRDWRPTGRRQQCHHRRSGRDSRPHNADSRRATHRQNGRHGGDAPWRTGSERQRFRRLLFVQRQRRDDRTPVVGGDGLAEFSGGNHQHPSGGCRARRSGGVRIESRGRLVPARGGRDLRRVPQRHQRLPRHEGACLSGPGLGDRWASDRGQCRRRHRNDVPRFQGRHRHVLASRRDRRRQFHSRRPGSGQPRTPTTSTSRRRASWPRDRP